MRRLSRWQRGVLEITTTVRVGANIIVRLSTLATLVYNGYTMAYDKVATFRLTTADLAILTEAQATFGLASRVEAMRLLIRLWDGSASVLEAAKVARARAKRRARKGGAR